ncbi:cytochrome P450 family protein [Sansalvadorimonas verongulae]|uniref:hypothetical protein n=1 Tax=Sansalvadorimonas verongulae TaxID=2172824 RepID=UPI0012BC969C|nr:hypothetical protein [Sansalvadorimonas verongulae]MTI13997.1 hypothetical protein [Sansalvadorimonas verongulae]
MKPEAVIQTFVIITAFALVFPPAFGASEGEGKDSAHRPFMKVDPSGYSGSVIGSLQPPQGKALNYVSHKKIREGTTIFDMPILPAGDHHTIRALAKASPDVGVQDLLEHMTQSAESPVVKMNIFPEGFKGYTTSMFLQPFSAEGWFGGLYSWNVIKDSLWAFHPSISKAMMQHEFGRHLKKEDLFYPLRMVLGEEALLSSEPEGGHAARKVVFRTSLSPSKLEKMTQATMSMADTFIDTWISTDRELSKVGETAFGYLVPLVGFDVFGLDLRPESHEHDPDKKEIYKQKLDEIKSVLSGIIPSVFAVGFDPVFYYVPDVLKALYLNTYYPVLGEKGEQLKEFIRWAVDEARREGVLRKVVREYEEEGKKRGGGAAGEEYGGHVIGGVKGGNMIREIHRFRARKQFIEEFEDEVYTSMLISTMSIDDGRPAKVKKQEARKSYIDEKMRSLDLETVTLEDSDLWDASNPFVAGTDKGANFFTIVNTKLAQDKQLKAMIFQDIRKLIEEAKYDDEEYRFREGDDLERHVWNPESFRRGNLPALEGFVESLLLELPSVPIIARRVAADCYMHFKEAPDQVGDTPEDGQPLYRLHLRKGQTVAFPTVKLNPYPGNTNRFMPQGWNDEDVSKRRRKIQTFLSGSGNECPGQFFARDTLIKFVFRLFTRGYDIELLEDVEGFDLQYKGASIVTANIKLKIVDSGEELYTNQFPTEDEIVKYQRKKKEAKEKKHVHKK